VHATSTLAALLTPETGGVLIELVSAVALTLVSIFLLPLLRARAAAAKTEAQRSAYQAAVDALDQAIGPAVAATEQVVASKLRAAAPNPGKLDTADASFALNNAVSRTIDHFGSPQLVKLTEALGISRNDLEHVIQTRIEAAVLHLKRDQGVSLALPEIAEPQS
jgi:hypothetical protein